jgi:hypothetical protein
MSLLLFFSKWTKETFMAGVSAWLSKPGIQRIMLFASVSKLKTSVVMAVLPGCRKKTELDS